MDTGLLLFRAITGLLPAGHGLQKVSCHLGGEGLEGGVQKFRDDGFGGGVLTAPAAGGGRIGGGLLFELGALTPLAAAPAIGVMVVAVTVKWRNGLWSQRNGFELPGYLVIASAALALHRARTMGGGSCARSSDVADDGRGGCGRRRGGVSGWVSGYCSAATVRRRPPPSRPAEPGNRLSWAEHAG